MILSVEKCGCQFLMNPFGEPEWAQCPLHANAARLLDACREVMAAYDRAILGGAVQFSSPIIDRIRAAVAAATKEPSC